MAAGTSAAGPTLAKGPASSQDLSQSLKQKQKMLRVVQLLVPKYPKCANSVVGNLVAPRTCSPSDLIVPRTCSPPNRSQKRKLFRVLRQCVVFSSRSNIGKDECSAVMDILLTHTLELRIMNAMPVGQTPWADQLE